MKVSDCVTLSPEAARSLSWMPVCLSAPRRRAALPLWHPRSPATQKAHEAGASVRGQVLSEDAVHPDDLEAYHSVGDALMENPMGWAVWAPAACFCLLPWASVFLGPGLRGCGGCFDAWRSPRWCPFLRPAPRGITSCLPSSPRPSRGSSKSGDATAPFKFWASVGPCPLRGRLPGLSKSVGAGAPSLGLIDLARTVLLGLVFFLRLGVYPMKFESTDSHIVTEELGLAVNASVTLQRPLLIREPGTGKTLLAEQVADPSGLSSSPGTSSPRRRLSRASMSTTPSPPPRFPAWG